MLITKRIYLDTNKHATVYIKANTSKIQHAYIQKNYSTSSIQKIF